MLRYRDKIRLFPLLLYFLGKAISSKISDRELNKDTILPGQYKAILKGKNHILELLASGNLLTKTLDNLVKILESHLIQSRCSLLILDKSGNFFSNGSSPNLPSSSR